VSFEEQGLLLFEWRRLGYNLGVLNEWLATANTGKQLAAAGYAIDPVVQHFKINIKTVT
jgi:hypothetical protein